MVLSLKKLAKPIPVLCFVIVLQLGYFFFLSTRPYRITPPGKTYNMLGKNFYYPSWIRLAKDGSWGLKDTHTTRPTPTVYAQLYFVFLGKLAALFFVDPVVMYIGARIVGTVVTVWAIYWFVGLFLPKWYAVFAAACATILEPGPSLASVTTGTVGQLVPSWDVHILYERRFALPHHLTGEALGVIFFGLLLLYTIRPPKKPTTIPLLMTILLLIGFMATTILPPYLVVFTGVLLLVGFFISVKQKTLPQFIALAVPAFIGIVLAGLLLNVEFSKGHPWTEQNATEKSWMDNTAVIHQYIGTLSLYVPFFLLGIGGAILRWKKMKRELKILTILSIAWLIVPVLLITVSKQPFFPFANFRLVDITGYFPAGILAALGLYHLTKCISDKKLRGIVVGIVLTVLFGSSLVLTRAYTKQIMTNQDNSRWGMDTFPTLSAWEGVLSMNKLPKGSNIMVRESFGEMLPAFGPVNVFIGGPHGWLDWSERRSLSLQFYSASMSTTDARNLLEENNIDYVFWGPDEQGYSQAKTLYPSLLVPVFSNADVTIFKIK